MASVFWALALDAMFGEFPSAIHPTVQMGRFIERGKTRHQERAENYEPQHVALIRGAVLVAMGIAGSAAVAGGLSALSDRLPKSLQPVASGALLKPALSLRALLSAASSIENALRLNNLDQARELLGWHLVSRETSNLSSSEVAAAAIESIAENLSDSVIAPLMYHKLGGLPAAYAYRFVNTADAMLGYHTPELEWFGKCAARTDDLLNFLPARLTAMSIVLAAPFVGGNVRRAYRVLRRDAKRTASPNAGWPMAATAGALNCRLAKRDHYVLNHHGANPNARLLRQARHLITAAAVIGIGSIEVIG